MPLLFSYGTLRDTSVQRALFGRQLGGQPDALVGYTRSRIPIVDPQERADAGLTHYANLIPSSDPTDYVDGTLLEVTDTELEIADRYEAPAGYERTLVTLRSGRRAWVYRALPARSLSASES